MKKEGCCDENMKEQNDYNLCEVLGSYAKIKNQMKDFN